MEGSEKSPNCTLFPVRASFDHGSINIDTLSEDQKIAFEEFKVRGERLPKLISSEVLSQSAEVRARAARTFISHLQAMDDIASKYEFLVLTGAENVIGYLGRVAPRYVISASNKTVVIVDTETTGLGCDDQPISLGLLAMEVNPNSGDVVKELESLYCLREPTVAIGKRAQEVHGITIDELKGKRFPLIQIRAILYSADVIIAHNAKFDRRMLGKLMPAVVNLEWACSLHGLRDIWSKKYIEKRSLDAICEHFEIDRAQPHNALSDCYALRDVLTFRTGRTSRSRRLLSQLVLRPWAPSPED